jgi:CTP synthase
MLIFSNPSSLLLNRFLDINLSDKHNITTGKVYREVIHQERRGDYLGKTVQIVPHATDMVQSWLKEVSKKPVDGTGIEPDVCLIEVGGTVGDIESMVFLEALRQFQFQVGRENILFVHVSYVPLISGEQKTKPTQHSVKELRSLGLSPDFIVCRSEKIVEENTKSKISTFCHVAPVNVISVHNVSNIYHVPLILVQQGIHTLIKERLHLNSMSAQPDLSSWATMAKTVDDASKAVKIALVGKYTQNLDSYLSVTKALKHAAIHLSLKEEIMWVEASDLEEETKLTNVDKYKQAWDAVK